MLEEPPRGEGGAPRLRPGERDGGQVDEAAAVVWGARAGPVRASVRRQRRRCRWSGGAGFPTLASERVGERERREGGKGEVVPLGINADRGVGSERPLIIKKSWEFWICICTVKKSQS